MLAQRTKEYTEMLFTDHREALNDYETTIFKLQEEIKSRAPKPENTSISDSNIKFTDESNEANLQNFGGIPS